MIPQKRMPTVMGAQERFSQVPDIQRDRSVFDRSHGYKTTFDSGYLIPFFVEYAMPGDTFDVRMTALARLTTPIKPFMDNMYFDTFFFAVPFRLIWANARKFFGEQDNPADSIAFTVPVNTNMPATGFAIHSIGDYMGLPVVGTPAVVASIAVSALPGRALKLIYNHWFRDENLVNSQTVSTGDGPDNDFMNGGPLKRGKRHDYFTSCLPSPQKGTAVAFNPLVVPESAGIVPTFTPPAGSVLQRQGVANPTPAEFTLAGAAGQDMGWDDPNLMVNFDLNQLRTAMATQQFLEQMARGGSRYTEIVYHQFGVESSDARLQRAEYLGGGSSPVSIAPIAQQTQTGLTGGNTPIGNLSAVAAVLAQGHGFTKSFEEHCVVIGLCNVRADLTYSQGIERFWSYSSRLDFPWPVFAHLGEQPVLNKEIFATGAAADANVFGYQERYAERRYKPSKVTGLFRPSVSGTLELWHLSEKFGALPTLGQTFIEDQTETVLDTRVAVPSEPDWYLDAWFEFKMAAALPVHGVPGLRRL